jgi:hypothetical protein
VGHHDEIDRTAEEAAKERALHEHPAKPEQTHDEGFEQGYDQRRDTPEEELEPNFARGISQEPPGGERRGRFSTGEEELPEADPEKNVERRFSEGIERDPTSD